MNKSRPSFKFKIGIKKLKIKIQFAHYVNAKGLYYKNMKKIHTQN